MGDSKINPKDRMYYENSCKLKKGYQLFECGGKSSFSNHYILINAIAGKDSRATITFSSEDYIVIDSHDSDSEIKYAKMQTPYNYLTAIPRPDILNECSSKKPQMFDFNYFSKHIGPEAGHYYSNIVLYDES
jgi:hypothetical protein